MVTVQLPLRNEARVVTRLLKAVTHLDYPKDQLQIQILDDSDDETMRVLENEVELLRKAEFRIEILHRDRPEGYKAGALQEGLGLAEGEFIAVFDADAVPRKDFLCKAVSILEKRQELGFVQGRYRYRNSKTNFWTRLQTILLEGVIDEDLLQKQKFDLPVQFAGSGGVWRKKCIQDIGGWTYGHLAEDLDLSYRAWIQGWKGAYVPDMEVEIDLPTRFIDFKIQQDRWTQGVMFCFRKLTLPILKSQFLNKFQKTAMCFHLGRRLLFVLPPLSILAVLPILLGQFKRERFSIFTPLWIILCGVFFVGWSFSQTVSCLKGFCGGGEFHRTPKGNDNELGFLFSPYRSTPTRGMLSE